MKKIVIMFICIIFSISLVKAEDGIAARSYKYDCSIGASSLDSLLDGLKDSLSNFKVLKKDDIKIAHDHLKAYCCKKGYLPNCSSSSDKIPESPYFIDQLVDVGFRKLDGDPDLSYGNQLDTDGQKRREEIRKIAKDPKGKNPGEIKDLFDKYWDVKMDSEDKLSSKYDLTCEEAYSVRLTSTQIFTDENIQNGYDGCMNIASSRVNNEITYANYVMAYKGIKYLKDAMHNYLMDYILKDKSMMLMEKLAEMQGRLGQWVQKVQGAEYCNGGSR